MFLFIIGIGMLIEFQPLEITDVIGIIMFYASIKMMGN